MTQKNINSTENITVPASALVDMFGIGDRRVRQLAEENIIIKVARGKYDLPTSVRNYIKYLKMNDAIKGMANDDELDLNTEKAKHEIVKREIAELKYAEMLGQLHDGEDVERVMNDMLTRFKSKILSLPSKLAPVLVSRDDVNVVKSFIERDILEALEELSSYDPALFYSDKYIDVDEGLEESCEVNAEENQKDKD